MHDGLLRTESSIGDGYTPPAWVSAEVRTYFEEFRNQLNDNKYVFVEDSMGDDLRLGTLGRVNPSRIYLNQDHKGPYIEVMLEDVISFIKRYENHNTSL